MSDTDLKLFDTMKDLSQKDRLLTIKRILLNLMDWCEQTEEEDVYIEMYEKLPEEIKDSTE